MAALQQRRSGRLPEGRRPSQRHDADEFDGAYGLAVSEHMLAMLLEIIKRLHTYRDAQKLHVWKGQGKVKSIHGSTVLVLGMGDIGGEFAQKVKALGAYVIGLRRTVAEKPEYADEMHLTAELDSLLPRADIVALCLPATKETDHLFSRERLALLKEGAILLNVGRGTLIDTEALCDTLESGRLFGAGLDVTDPEPLPEGHRLWDIPNAVLLPIYRDFTICRKPLSAWCVLPRKTCSITQTANRSTTPSILPPAIG
ncbi:D-2-hydroxyacid dehydrogenase [Clostridium sp. KNHs216]|uniref:D-2-hydroxyacid dehydrogenase n=1 Tax=Clostridium sp. KNHs216 TaxID=1550235 RepID=UPI001FAA76FE|nr:D-2-hydroxyacid dehydrogenase [Clostridium sp. KNHs216]